MEKGNLTKWVKKEGDTVKAGDVIAEIETDKATMEVEAVDEGILGKILIPEGTQDVAVNTPIAVILGEGEDASAASAPAPQQKVAESAAPALPGGPPPPRRAGERASAVANRRSSPPSPIRKCRRAPRWSR